MIECRVALSAIRRCRLDNSAEPVACLYGLIVGMLIYRSISFRQLGPLFVQTAISSAVVMYLMGTANAFSYIITSEQIPQAIAAQILDYTSVTMLIMLLVMILLLVNLSMTAPFNGVLNAQDLIWLEWADGIQMNGMRFI